jgi:hypothetical protein
MKISVVVPCRNAAGRLRPTLESIQRPGALDLLRARVGRKPWELPSNWKKRLNPLLRRYDRGVARWA